MCVSLPAIVGTINVLSISQCPFQVFPGSLLPCPYEDPQNPDHLLARSEVERRREFIQLLHRQLPEQHPLVQLVHRCLHNTPARRFSAEELLQQLEAVRAQIEGPYGQIVSVNMEKLRMVRALREKDTEIGHLQQQMQEMEVGSVWGHTGTCWYYSGHSETLTWRHPESIQDYHFSYVHQKYQQTGSQSKMNGHSFLPLLYSGYIYTV